ncbi:hypothetical protein CLAFUW4_10634 [Fulvia fulva]|uniref:Uncharacterized protein n=1 Tax=Passalora fulva TaxID=5499 RepID=A0A9Q8LF46_PASFU|nr:uncharacterized protein CLAFUR5_05247 [Fulvia fulva]KAK4615530.1 hypothetical protein CLAFUR4_10639 [Fulvia fulva]KAK4617384.1 hypothetical protein CLAFUR0_10605 [Fulvia fulva]UJO16271.1 hypothetical protein CLAFUR5_05247 [Fulvia fulva]WPV18901.1 hypothetical protein CLAFUW4_10634 [Fulvia fulva]WPV34500.1 hypothetical protein CLAFUW7_10636 [Fulvia fulva]
MPNHQGDSSLATIFPAASPQQMVAADEVFNTPELLEMILMQLQDTHSVLKHASLSRAAQEIILEKCGRDLRWVTYLQPVNNKKGRETWLVEKGSEHIIIVDQSYAVQWKDRKVKMLQRPVVLNPTLCQDKYYNRVRGQRRLSLTTEVVEIHPFVKNLIMHNTKKDVDEFLATSFAKMLVCQPPTKTFLIDWYQEYDNDAVYGGGYGSSGAYPVRNDAGVRLSDILDGIRILKRRGVTIKDFRIPGVLFLSHRDWESISLNATAVPLAAAPDCQMPRTVLRSGDKFTLHDLFTRSIQRPETLDRPAILPQVLWCLSLSDAREVRLVNRRLARYLAGFHPAFLGSWRMLTQGSSGDSNDWTTVNSANPKYGSATTGAVATHSANPGLARKSLDQGTVIHLRPKRGNRVVDSVHPQHGTTDTGGSAITSIKGKKLGRVTNRFQYLRLDGRQENGEDETQKDESKNEQQGNRDHENPGKSNKGRAEDPNPLHRGQRTWSWRTGCCSSRRVTAGQKQ